MFNPEICKKLLQVSACAAGEPSSLLKVLTKESFAAGASWTERRNPSSNKRNGGELSIFRHRVA
jgi:hypothetical protein